MQQPPRHIKKSHLYKSKPAVKVDVSKSGIRGSFVTSSGSQLPPILLLITNRQASSPPLAFDTESRLFHSKSRLDGSWQGMDELDWLHAIVLPQQLAAACGFGNNDLHQQHCVGMQMSAVTGKGAVCFCQDMASTIWFVLICQRMHSA